MSKELLQTVSSLTDSVAIQCGLMATMTRHAHVDGGRSTTVQIRLVPDHIAAVKCDDWLFLTAYSDDELHNLRDQLTDFIAENRRSAA